MHFTNHTVANLSLANLNIAYLSLAKLHHYVSMLPQPNVLWVTEL